MFFHIIFDVNGRAGRISTLKGMMEGEIGRGWKEGWGEDGRARGSSKSEVERRGESEGGEEGVDRREREKKEGSEGRIEGGRQEGARKASGTRVAVCRD